MRIEKDKKTYKLGGGREETWKGLKFNEKLLSKPSEFQTTILKIHVHFFMILVFISLNVSVSCFYNHLMMMW